jgi:glutaredoxin-related protein
MYAKDGKRRNKMIKIYGREDCQDCVNLKASLDANNVEYDFRNIGDSLHDMAVFIKIRDTNPVFDEIKGTGKIGIPAVVTEDRSVFLDWEGYLKEKGLQIIKSGQSCSIDGKNC